MISIGSEDDTLITGDARRIVLVVTNDGPRRCSGIGFTVRASADLRVERGPRSVDIDGLGPGERAERAFTVRPGRAGEHRLRVAGLRFIEDGASREGPDREIVLVAGHRPASTSRSPDGERPGVFVSYRHGDVDDVVTVLVALIRQRFDAVVFHDRPALVGGDLWPQRIEREVDASTVAVVVIGPRWAGGTSVDRRRLFEVDDWVAFEVEHALRGGERTVIPVLVGTQAPSKAMLPAELSGLADRHAVVLGTTGAAALAPDGAAPLLDALARYLPPV